MGRSILESMPDMDPNGVVTGHEETTVLMEQLTIDALKQVDVPPHQATVSIIGAGSIGAASAMMLDGKVKTIVIQDARVDKAERVEEMILNSRSGRGISNYTEVVVVGAEITDEMWESTPANGDLGIDNLGRLRSGDVVLTATSSPKPFVKGRFFEPGTIFVDDSQPPNVTFSEAEGENGGVLVRVVGSAGPVHRTINYGLVDGHEFGCALQTNVTAVHYMETGQLVGACGHVTYERAVAVKNLMETYGVGSPVFERDGIPITGADWDRVRRSRVFRR